jgi:predicted O-methyltransferase YrrM
LELGTGIGLSLVWMIDGLSDDSSLISIDNNLEFISIVHEFFGKIKNVEVIFADACRGNTANWKRH